MRKTPPLPWVIGKSPILWWFRCMSSMVFHTVCPNADIPRGSFVCSFPKREARLEMKLSVGWAVSSFTTTVPLPSTEIIWRVCHNDFKVLSSPENPKTKIYSHVGALHAFTTLLQACRVAAKVEIFVDFPFWFYTTERVSHV